MTDYIGISTTMSNPHNTLHISMINYIGISTTMSNPDNSLHTSEVSLKMINYVEKIHRLMDCLNLLTCPEHPSMQTEPPTCSAERSKCTFALDGHPQVLGHRLVPRQQLVGHDLGPQLVQL